MSDPGDDGTESKVRVLVVEDEYFIAEELRHVLSEAGFQVLGPASSNGAALDLLEAELPHVATLDVHMGGVRVTPVAERLQQLNIPFVLASASSTHELSSDPVLASAVNLGKPTDADRLVKTIRNLVA